MACSSATVQRVPQFPRPTKQKHFLVHPPQGPQPQVLLQRVILWSLVGPCPGPRRESLTVGSPGATPLHIAAEEGHRELVQQLIAAGPLGGGLDLPSPGRNGGPAVRASVEGAGCQREGTLQTLLGRPGVPRKDSYKKLSLDFPACPSRAN